MAKLLKRDIENSLLKREFKGKAIIISGARQVGKTTLVKNILKDKPNYLFLDCDDPVVRNALSNPSTEQLKSIIADNKILFIDEAQRVENIGVTLKIIVDQFKDLQLLVSGSSSFELNSQINEPLTGRKWEYTLYPISWNEFERNVGYLKAESQLELRLIYGMYPEILNNIGDEKERLKLLTDSYLYKDILAFNKIQKPEVLEKLLIALAMQLGNEVSYNELSKLLQIDKNTVSNYIQILENNFIIYRLTSFARNIRNEIGHNRKIYFWDNGVRNAIIGNFSGLDLRLDKGTLWENFLVSERLKQNAYNFSFAKTYFWRTTTQQEIDYIEEEAGKISAFEIKWNENTKSKALTNFKETYKTDIKVIHRKNFREFILNK